MKTALSHLKSELRKKHIWLVFGPDSIVHLGDVFRVHHTIFGAVTGLSPETKLPPELSAHPEQADGKADLDTSTGAQVDIQVKASGSALAGSTLPLAEAGFGIKIGAGKTAMVKAHDCTFWAISNPEPIKKWVHERFVADDDADDYLVVTGLYRTQSTVVLGSIGRGSELDISASGKAIAAGVSIADPAVKLEIKTKSGDVYFEKVTPREGVESAIVAFTGVLYTRRFLGAEVKSVVASDAWEISAEKWPQEEVDEPEDTPGIA